MNLYLMRHGFAVEPGTPGYDSDGERPLTSKGERRVRRVAEALAKMEVSFDLIFSSPLVRARQTAQALVEEAKDKQKVQLTEHLAPGGSPKELIELLQGASGPAQEILLVGHEPDLSRLASLLLTGGDGPTVIFKKGGTAKLAIDKLRAGRCATIEWLMTSHQLEMMT